MTSESDSTSRRRPPTIDLKAQEVEAERPAQEARGADEAGDRAEERQAARQAGRTLAGPLALALAACLGAIVAGAVLAGIWIAGDLPARGGAAVPVAQAPQSRAVDEIGARLDKIQEALQSRQPDSGLPARVTTAEAQTKSLGDSLTALNRRLDEIAVTAKTALTHADTASASADASKNAQQADVPRSDFDALATRVAGLERAIKSVSEDVARRASSADDRVARMTVAAEAMRSVVERGAPYQSELAAVRSLGADQKVLAPLEPLATDGVPTVASLAHELAALTPALLHASGTTPGENSFLGRLQSNAQKLVRISPLDAPQGDDPAAVTARANAAAARGDLGAALAEIARLPAAARSLAEPWTKKAEARQNAIAASRRVAADALAALATPAPQ